MIALGNIHTQQRSATTPAVPTLFCFCGRLVHKRQNSHTNIPKYGVNFYPYPYYPM